MRPRLARFGFYKAHSYRKGNYEASEGRQDTLGEALAFLLGAVCSALIDEFTADVRA
jgi:hypothetical protein